MSEPCKYEGTIATIVTDLKNFKENFQHFRDNDFQEIKKDLKCLVGKINKPRLPMYITWTLTLCSGLIVGLIVAFIKK